MTRFTIEGQIKPKERPRRARSGHFYTPPATLASEDKVAKAALQVQMRPVQGPIDIEAVFYGNYARADLDNLIKTLLDGLHAYFNDRQVVSIHTSKRNASEYWTEVCVCQAQIPPEKNP